MWTGIQDLGLLLPQTAVAPFNIWMRMALSAEGQLSYELPVCKAGDVVEFRAEMDLILAFSACPNVRL